MKKDDLAKLRKNILKKIKIFLNLFFNNNKIENTQIKILKEPDSLKNKEKDLDIKRQKDIEEAKFYEKILENPENFLLKDDSEYDEIDSYKENMERLSKEELLKKYDEIKKGAANIEDLTNSDLIKIEALLKAEISIQNRKKEEYEKVEREIFELEENKILMEKIKKNESGEE